MPNVPIQNPEFADSSVMLWSGDPRPLTPHALIGCSPKRLIVAPVSTLFVDSWPAATFMFPLRGCDKQDGSMGTSNVDIQIMGTPSKY